VNATMRSRCVYAAAHRAPLADTLSRYLCSHQRRGRRQAVDKDVVAALQRRCQESAYPAKWFQSQSGSSPCLSLWTY
jgi:hypothetical protein